MLLLEIKKTNGSLDTIHFVGIGGIGMSGIAEIMHNLGYKVQGSDAIKSANTARLEACGIKVFYEHSSENIHNVSYVVVSSAINKDNPEVCAAITSKIPVIRRAEMLAGLMRLKCSIAVSGSHGKTTTTSLIACLFEAAGLNPTVINGGIINGKYTNAYLGSDNYLIAEADESDATFIQLPSTIAVITNIDPEHIDFYGDFTRLIESFKCFITNLPFYGFAVACVDHSIVKKLVNEITCRKIITYGIEESDANVRAYDIRSDINSSTFSVKIRLPHLSTVTTIEDIKIPTPGRHNILNSLAAIAVGAELDFGLKVIKKGFNQFQGVKRRFTKVHEYNGANIIDDYAHHPVEIAATLQTARTIANKQHGKVIAIFQPHRYSRLKNLFNEFAQCFGDADIVYITDVYAAGEEMIDSYSGTILVQHMIDTQAHKDVAFIADPNLIQTIIKTQAQKGDLVIMMGAGNISTWSNELSNQLK